MTDCFVYKCKMCTHKHCDEQNKTITPHSRHDEDISYLKDKERKKKEKEKERNATRMKQKRIFFSCSEQSLAFICSDIC